MTATRQLPPRQASCVGLCDRAIPFTTSFCLRATSPSVWCSFALHWMSALPTALREHIWPALASSDESKGLAKVAAADWRNFLAHPTEELTPGGQLVLVIGAVDETCAARLEPMMDLANDILRTLVTEGKLGAQTCAAMTIPSRPRSREELTGPFDKGDIAELSLEELVIAETPNAAMLHWRQTGDAARLAPLRWANASSCFAWVRDIPAGSVCSMPLKAGLFDGGDYPFGPRADLLRTGHWLRRGSAAYGR
jgi:hypothetical protein